MKLLIKGGTIVNWDKQQKQDILIENSRIVKVARDIDEKGSSLIDAKGKYVFPGLIDMHAHLRTPGREDEETLETGSLAAAKGGFTTVLCMPNTSPAIDTYEVALRIRKESEKLGLVDIFPVGAITKSRQGKQLSEFGFLKEAGCIAVSDDGSSVNDSAVMRRALEYAENFGLLVISHCEDPRLSQGGLIRESALSDSWGIPSIPEISETTMVSRDIEIARFIGARIHLAHISCARSVQLIARAKKDGVLVSAETCPHYFTFTLEDIAKGFNPNFKVNPPLGTAKDLKAVSEALAGGVIDCIATDHAPHTWVEKEATLYEAAFGMIGLEFALSSTLRLVEKGVIKLEDLVSKLAYSPARILGLEDRGQIKEGLRADIAVVDISKEWLVRNDTIFSKSKNTALLGQRLQGAVDTTIYKGKVVYSSKG